MLPYETKDKIVHFTFFPGNKTTPNYL